MITDLLRTVTWSDKIHPSAVVSLRFKDKTFPLPATVLYSKENAFQIKQPPHRDEWPTSIPSGEVIKSLSQKC